MKPLEPHPCQWAPFSLPLLSIANIKSPLVLALLRCSWIEAAEACPKDQNKKKIRSLVGLWQGVVESIRGGPGWGPMVNDGNNPTFAVAQPGESVLSEWADKKSPRISGRHMESRPGPLWQALLTGATRSRLRIYCWPIAIKTSPVTIPDSAFWWITGLTGRYPAGAWVREWLRMVRATTAVTDRTSTSPPTVGLPRQAHSFKPLEISLLSLDGAKGLWLSGTPLKSGQYRPILHGPEDSEPSRATIAPIQVMLVIYVGCMHSHLF